MPAPGKLLKMLGTVAWCGLAAEYSGRISRGILRGGSELVIDLDCEGHFYSVTLERRAGDQFEGSWRDRYGGTGAASATLYRSSGGELLFGEWAEEGTRYHWSAELSVVAHFPDEK